MFKRIRKFYKRNRIYCILMIVSFVCLVTLGSALVIYFYNQATSDPAGSRTINKENYPVDKEVEACKKYFTESEGVEKVSMNIKNNIIWITVYVDAEMKVEDIQNLGIGSLESFTAEQLGYYDLQFAFIREGYPSLNGSKSAQNTIISWEVYNLDYDKEEETTTKTTKKK